MKISTLKEKAIKEGFGCTLKNFEQKSTEYLESHEITFNYRANCYCALEIKLIVANCIDELPESLIKIILDKFTNLIKKEG